MNKENIIEMNHITKAFPGIIANDDITLQLRKGEIHTLLGENGAGKSTLMSILFGLYKPDKGEILFKGKPINIKDPNDATKYGIGMVHQHFMLVDVFTGLQNIVLGYEENKFGVLKYNETRKKLKELQQKYNLFVDLDKKIEDMTVGMQQRVEILKMLYRDNDILIFDEPTAVLTPNEIEGLIKVIKTLQKEGKTILFISHKLNEVKELSDRITVLRKGKYIGTYDNENLTTDDLASLMVGRKVNFKTEKKPVKIGKKVLEVNHLFVKGKGLKYLAKDVNFSVSQGEIVALLGIDGNGQENVVEAITGLSKIYHGNIKLNGIDITKLNINKRNKSGISHIPADRHRYGLVLDYNMMYNFILENYKHKKFSKMGFLKNQQIKNYGELLIKEYDIRSSEGVKTITRSMSGGNQQKVIVAREIDRNNDLLIAVQPTRGLDVGAIENIHNQIQKVKESKHAVLLVSLELDEVFDLADRILVIYEGEIVGEFKPDDIDYSEIGLYMSGAKKDYNLISDYHIENKENFFTKLINKLKVSIKNKKENNENE